MNIDVKQYWVDKNAKLSQSEDEIVFHRWFDSDKR